MPPLSHRLHSLPLRGRCHGDAVTEGAPCRRLGSHPASFGLILLCSRLSPFHDFGIGGIWASVFCLGITALPLPPKRRITQTKTPTTQASYRRRTERCVRHAGQAPFEDYQVTDSRALSEVGRGRSWCVPDTARPRGLIFPKNRKVLLFSFREARHVSLTQQKLTTQTTSMP